MDSEENVPSSRHGIFIPFSLYPTQNHHYSVNGRGLEIVILSEAYCKTENLPCFGSKTIHSFTLRRVGRKTAFAPHRARAEVKQFFE